jgi:hypothetical protein
MHTTLIVKLQGGVSEVICKCSRQIVAKVLAANYVWRFGTRMRAESEWRFGTHTRPKSAKSPTFNAIISAPLLQIIEE